jgi:hypothetical protein
MKENKLWKIYTNIFKWLARTLVDGKDDDSKDKIFKQYKRQYKILFTFKIDSIKISCLAKTKMFFSWQSKDENVKQYNRFF